MPDDIVIRRERPDHRQVVALLDALDAYVETGRDQTAAVRLLERRGYRRSGPFGGYPDNGLSLSFEKSL